MDSLIRRIYQQFATRALTADEQSLYVDLDPARGDVNVAQRLERSIRLAGEPTCQVLAGHDGTGKSTELFRLQRRLQTPDEYGKRWFTVFCQADRDVNRNDVDFPEVLIAVVRQVAEQLSEREQITLTPGYFADRIRRLKDLLGREVDFDKFDLTTGMMKLSGVIRNSPDARADVRKLLEPDTGNLIDAANDVIGEATLRLSERGWGGLAIIIDDLDKMVLRSHESAKCTTLEYLFVHRAAQLRAFRCHVVYTMPLELPYSSAEQTIENLYGKVEVVPMTKLATRPPAIDVYEPGVELFRQVIRRRLAAAAADESDLFGGDDALRDRLIRLTGGQPTELMTLVREAIVGGDDLPVRPAALDRIVRPRQGDVRPGSCGPIIGRSSSRCVPPARSSAPGRTTPHSAS